MSTLMQKFFALFSPAMQNYPEPPQTQPALGGMPLASPAYLHEFAQRLGLEVDDLSPAEQDELKSRLDASMDFRQDNYRFLYHQVYQLGHGYTLADATRVSALISSISEEAAASAYLDYRENSVAAEALMAAATLLQAEGEGAAADRLFGLAEARRHRSSLLGGTAQNPIDGLAEMMAAPTVAAPESVAPDAAAGDAAEQNAATRDAAVHNAADDDAADADRAAGDAAVGDAAKPGKSKKQPNKTAQPGK